MTEQPAAIIDPPRTVIALNEHGLADLTVWGWVKTSAKFRAHIKILRGAKHDIWHYLALGVDENGRCKETIKEICEGTGYSHTEVINTLRELDVLGYLSIQKNAKGNTYTPEFVARGERIPTENVVKKVESSPVESSPVYQVESSPAMEKSNPPFKRVKRVNTPKFDIAKAAPEWGILAGVEVDEAAQNARIIEAEAVAAFESAWGLSTTWSEWWDIKPEWKRLREFVVARYTEDAAAFRKYVAWYDERGKFGGGVNPTQIRRSPGIFYTAWDMFKRGDAPQDKISLLRTL